YLREFLRYAATVQMPYNVIETFDQPWKRAQEGTAGGYWGILDVHAKPKFAMQGPVVEESAWWLGWLAGIAGAGLFALTGCWWRHWRGRRGFVALALAGFASGAALAWQFRQMGFACRNPWEWLISLIACAFALITAIQLARWIAARLAGMQQQDMPAGWQRLVWLFVLAFYGLLLVFDGRYRDLPLGLVELPCIGYALVAALSDRYQRTTPLLEEYFLAAMVPLLAAIVVVQEAGQSSVAWLWLGLNLAIAMPVLFGWHTRRIMQAQQP
ncbi:MAG: glycoside hydrolase family 17, partial [Rhodanobacter sp.]